MKILILDNKWFEESLPKNFLKEHPMMEVGWGNGYVLIPRNHPLHGKHYDEINKHVAVHGGLTYSRIINARAIKYFGLTKRHLGKWMVGFDTMYYEDNKRNCSRGYVLQQTYLLKEELKYYVTAKP